MSDPYVHHLQPEFQGGLSLDCRVCNGQVYAGFWPDDPQGDAAHETHDLTEVTCVDCLAEKIQELDEVGALRDEDDPEPNGEQWIRDNSGGAQ